MSEHLPSWAVWGDGSGTTFRAAAEDIHTGLIGIRIDLVITTDPTAGILDFVEELNQEPYNMDIETMVVEGQQGKVQPLDVQQSILRRMNQVNISNLGLLGCLTFMGEALVKELNGDVPEQELPHTLEDAQKLMVSSDDGSSYYLPKDFPHIDMDPHRHLFNTHPAPTIVTANKWGPGAHRRMIDLRSTESAHTFHAVGLGVDTGPIAAARKFPIPLAPQNASNEVKKLYAKKVGNITQTYEREDIGQNMEMISKIQAVA